MKKKILIFTSTLDLTVDYIIYKYSHVADFYRVNIDLLSDYSIDINAKGWQITNENWSICSTELNSIYYRKPRMPNLDDFEFRYQFLIQKDIIVFIEGLVNSFNGYVLSKPCILHSAENKIFQLLRAVEVGFEVPKSTITNNTSLANAFVNEKSIIKPLSTAMLKSENKIEFFQTNLITDFPKIDISLTPTFLQKYITKKFEVRATFVGDQVFCVKIDSTNKVDWRSPNAKNRYSIIQMPNEIYMKSLALLKTLSLDFGAFDFIVDDRNKWIFLEVNPNGQWLWLEQILNINISERIVKMLDV